MGGSGSHRSAEDRQWGVDTSCVCRAAEDLGDDTCGRINSLLWATCEFVAISGGTRTLVRPAIDDRSGHRQGFAVIRDPPGISGTEPAHETTTSRSNPRGNAATRAYLVTHGTGWAHDLHRTEQRSRGCSDDGGRWRSRLRSGFTAQEKGGEVRWVGTHPRVELPAQFRSGQQVVRPMRTPRSVNTN